MTAHPGFHPLSDDDWPEEIRDLLPGFAGALNVYRSMAHHPALLRAMVDLREHVVNNTALGPTLSEITILRTGHRLGSTYEMQHHIVRARSRGVNDERIASMTGSPSDMAPTDAIIARAVDELFDLKKLSAESIAALEATAGKEGVFDLICTVGFYTILGFSLNSFEVPVDEVIVDALKAHPLGTAG